MTKEKMFEILSALSNDMRIPEDRFGYEPGPCKLAIKQLQEQGFIKGMVFAEGGWDRYPKAMWVDRGYVTDKGLQFIEDYQKSEVNLPKEFISACAKIADNPISYGAFDEDGLNREIRNYLDSAISRFGYTIADQTQQGSGDSGRRPSELDIRICKNGIPVAIYEGLIHDNKKYLYEHIEKAINRYNVSGCRAIYVIEYSKNKGFDTFWNNTVKAFDEYVGVSAYEEETGLLGVRMLKGKYEWEGQYGEFYYFGVNCYAK